jgi:hypothetical protein
MKVGMDYSAVEKSFAGSQCTQGTSGMLRSYTYPKFKFTFIVNDENKVLIIVTANPRYTLADGTKIGARKSAIIKRYGQGQDDGEYIFYHEKGIGFRIVNDEVVEIGVLAPSTPPPQGPQQGPPPQGPPSGPPPSPPPQHSPQGSP